ncbi:MAG: outer membrane beta-barrel protein, partial [Chitinophagaceae bacterium]
MRLRLAFIITILMLVQLSFAQQINGTTKDLLSKQPLPHATVSLKNIHDSSFLKQTTADNKGAFAFRNLTAGTYSISIEYIGYKSFVKDSVVLNDKEKLALEPLYLSLEAQQLKNVTVTAAKPFIVQSADKITLNVAESPVSAGSNAYDVLQKAPGVLADANGNLQVKGKSVNVYIDGRPSNLSNEELKNMLTTLSAATIDKIEVISNPSARYDAQGGSVINIKTVKNKNFGTNGQLTAGAGFGRFGRYNGGINFNNRSKNANIYGSYDYVNNAQYFSRSSVRYIAPGLDIRENEYDVRHRDNHSYKLGLDYDFSKRTSAGILVKGYTNFRDLAVTNTSVLSTTGADSSSSVHTYGYARFFNPSANAYLRTTLDKAGKKELTLNADYFQYQKIWCDDLATNFFDEKLTEYRPAVLMRDNSPADNTVKSISADYTQPWKKGKLEVGLKSTFTVTDNDVTWENKSDSAWVKDAGKTNRFVYKENINAAYITYNRAFKKYNITAGLRAEQSNTEGESVTMNQVNNRSYFNLFPNMNVMYTKSLKQQYSFAYRKSIVRYGFDLVNPFIIYQSQYTYSQGNPYLSPQINHTVEFSHAYNYRLFTTLSYTHASNSLSPVYKQDPATNLLISSYDNLASNDILIATTTLNKTFFKKWTSVNTIGGFYVRYKFGSDV